MSGLSNLLILTGTLTTAHALWVPAKRALVFENADNQDFSSQTKHTTQSTKTHTTLTRTKKATTTTKQTKTTKTTKTTTSALTTTLSTLRPSSISIISSMSSSSSIISSSSMSSSIMSSSSMSSSSSPTSMSSIMSMSSPTSMAATPSLRVMVNNSGASSSATVSIDRASASSPASENMSSAPTGAIVGGIFGFLALLMIGSAGLLYVRRKRRRELKRSRAANMTRVEPTYQDYTDEQPEMTTQPEPVMMIAPNPTLIAAPAKNEPLGLYTVIATYTPTLSDELEIEPGDTIELLTEYDDGWCQGINVSKANAKGVFPRHCIDQAPPLHPLPLFEKERTKRVSSICSGPEACKCGDKCACENCGNKKKSSCTCQDSGKACQCGDKCAC